eukprot:s1132_g3.t1
MSRILSSGSKRTGSRDGSRTGSDASLPTPAKVASKSTLSPSSASGTEVMLDCLSNGQLESVMESDADHDKACGPVASNSLSRPSSRGNLRSEGSSPRKVTNWQVPLDSAPEDCQGQGRSRAVLQQPQACEQHLHIMFELYTIEAVATVLGRPLPRDGRLETEHVSPTTKALLEGSASARCADVTFLFETDCSSRKRLGNAWIAYTVGREGFSAKPSFSISDQQNRECFAFQKALRVADAGHRTKDARVLGQTATLNSAQQHAQLPCASNFQQCISACGVAEFQALYDWLLASPQQAEDVDVIAAGQAGPSTSGQRTSLELSTFQLLRDVGRRGLSVLGSTLDYLTLCQHSDARCGEVMEQFRSVQAIGQALDERMRSDLQAFLRQLPSLSAGLAATELAARLAQTVGQRARMLSWHLGCRLRMHAWAGCLGKSDVYVCVTDPAPYVFPSEVRGLRVPGRGAPVLILHEEYMSFQDMTAAVVGTMVRNGQSQMALVEIGVPLEDWSTLAALRDFPGVQYAGIMAEPDRPSEIEGRAFIFEQRRAELQTSLGDRGVLYLASLQRLSPTAVRLAADAFPSRSMDVAMVDFRGRSADYAQEQMALWESKVKPGGVLLGVGFSPTHPEIAAPSGRGLCVSTKTTPVGLRLCLGSQPEETELEFEFWKRSALSAAQDSNRMPTSIA